MTDNTEEVRLNPVNICIEYTINPILQCNESNRLALSLFAFETAELVLATIWTHGSIQVSLSAPRTVTGAVQRLFW